MPVRRPPSLRVSSPAGPRPLAALLVLAPLACGDAGAGTGLSAGLTAGGTSDLTSGGPASTSGSTPTTGDASASGTASSDGGIKFDMGAIPDTMPPPPSCKVVDDMDATGDCAMKAPPDAFEPDVQWSFSGMDGETQAQVTPLVANLTDDNGDGAIDLCDVPEVIVGLYATYDGQGNGHLYALDGATGAVQWKSATAVDTLVTPALADIDGDGLVEIVAVDPAHQLIAFEHDGSLAWQSNVYWQTNVGSIALADVDNDGKPEIIAGNRLHHADGSVKTTLPIADPIYSATTAADLDGDGDLEIIMGNSAYHHDGSLLWQTNLDDGFPQVADLDDDGEPEVLLTNRYGISVIEHDGTIKYQDLAPTGDPSGVPCCGNNWRRPATIHDFDGDGQVEYALSSRAHYAVYESDASILWQADVMDISGLASGTAFDFDGNGVAEAMYADEAQLFVYGGMGQVLLQAPRSSGTITEYPVVADVDNDGSAEIVVVSSVNSLGDPQTAPAVQVIRDVEDRWIQARRIWNQHTYHVTNVREDGTIPQFEQPHWDRLNTFRTNAQIEGGQLCQPRPPG